MFEVTARRAIDGHTYGRTVVVNIVGRGLEVDAALGLTCLNSDDLAVGQGHSHRSLGRVGQRHGISDDAAFGGRRSGGQRCSGDIDGICNFSNQRPLRWGYCNATAPAGTGDRCRNLPTINVGRVIRRDHDIDTASGLPGRNDDHRAVGQRDDKVAARCLANRSGIDNDATRFADRWRGPDHKGGGNRSASCRRGDSVVSGGLRSSHFHGGGRRCKTKAFGREAYRGINAAGRFFQHDETVAATCCTAARSSRTGSRGFKIGGRVSACGDRLLQFFDRRRRLGSGLAQIGTAVRRVCAPLGITTKVEQSAICQLQRHRATRAGKDLLTR